MQRYPEQHTAIMFGTAEKPELHLDAELLGTCRRAIWHCVRNDPGENRPGSREAEAGPYLKYGTKLEAEAALREIALDALRKQGWRLAGTRSHPGEYGENRPRERLRVFGRPDAVGSHPERTRGWDAALTVRTEWRENPGDEGHAMRTAFCRNHPPGETPSRPGGTVTAVIAAADAGVRLEGDQPERTLRAERGADAWLAGLQEFLEQDAVTGDALEQNPPARDFPADSAWCRECPWLTACRGNPQGRDETREDPTPRGA